MPLSRHQAVVGLLLAVPGGEALFQPGAGLAVPESGLGPRLGTLRFVVRTRAVSEQRHRAILQTWGGEVGDALRFIVASEGCPAALGPSRCFAVNAPVHEYPSCRKTQELLRALHAEAQQQDAGDPVVYAMLDDDVLVDVSRLRARLAAAHRMGVFDLTQPHIAGSKRHIPAHLAWGYKVIGNARYTERMSNASGVKSFCDGPLLLFTGAGLRAFGDDGGHVLRTPDVCSNGDDAALTHAFVLKGMQCVPMLEPLCHNVELGDNWRTRQRDRREVYLRRDKWTCASLAWPRCQASLGRGVAWHLMNDRLAETEASHQRLRWLDGRNGTVLLLGDEAAAVQQIVACSEQSLRDAVSSAKPGSVSALKFP